MAVTPNNVVEGPATIYWGSGPSSPGTTEPADTNAAITQPPSSTYWTDFGATTGGVTLNVNMTYTQIKADQLVDPIGARFTARTIQVMVNLLEPTLNNLAFNNAAVVNVLSGVTTFDPTTTTSATQPAYSALVIDGWAPTLESGLQAKRRMIIRKVLNDVKASAKYDMTNQVTWDCTFTAYYVSSTLSPFHIVDQTS
jgi:hypothetical protein